MPRPRGPLPTDEPLSVRMWRQMLTGLAPPEERRSVEDYFGDPLGFVRHAFVWPPDSKGPTAYQRETLGLLRTTHRLALRGPHQLGKSALESWVVLWFACTREALGIDWKAATTAGSWHQLTHYLWPEIHKWARRLRPDFARALGIAEGRTLLQFQLRLRHGEAFAAASNRAELIEGAHATQLLFAFDEAKSIGDATWDAAEGAFAGGSGDSRTGTEAWAIAASTPGEPQGRFYDIHRKAPGYEDWLPRHVTLAEAIRAGMVSQAWAEARARQWGEGSQLYQNRVLGEFATSDEDSVIPLAWIEAAQARWLEWQDSGRDAGPMDAVGVDVGRGVARTILAPRHGHLVSRLIQVNTIDSMAVADRIAELLDRAPGSYAQVDAIGFGAGAFDRLRQLRKPAHAFIAGARSPFVDASGEIGFLNRRAEGWWRLRELLDPHSPDEPLLLPNVERLTRDLAAPHWHDAGGKIQVESKEEIQRRLGRSTDEGDSVVMAFAPPIIARKRRWSGAVAGEKMGVGYEVR